MEDDASSRQTQSLALIGIQFEYIVTMRPLPGTTQASIVLCNDVFFFLFSKKEKKSEQLSVIPSLIIPSELVGVRYPPSQPLPLVC